jgi:hypothetical protein
MKVAFTMPTAGAGKWAWQGWVNAFQYFGAETINLRGVNCNEVDPDIVICTTSEPRDDIMEWRMNNPKKKLALNVLAWTDEDLPGINNAGVQATPGNVEYAHGLEPTLVFAQYSQATRDALLEKWAKAGFALGSMEMAADATIYPFPVMHEDPLLNPDIFYVGGYWAYKAQNLDRYILPCFRKHQSMVIGKGWPFGTNDLSEAEVGHHFRDAKVVLNAHEPHSTIGGYDVVERVFKALYSGGLVVSDYVTEIETGFDLFNFEHLIMHAAPQDFMNEVDEIIANPGAMKYERIRFNGQKKVALHHTYFNRVLMLLLDLGEQSAYDFGVNKLHVWQHSVGLIP